MEGIYGNIRNIQTQKAEQKIWNIYIQYIWGIYWNIIEDMCIMSYSMKYMELEYIDIDRILLYGIYGTPNFILAVEVCTKMATLELRVVSQTR